MRTLSLRIPGKPNLFGRPDVNVKLSEQPDGTVLFEFSPRNKTFDDFFAVYFDTRTTGLASRLKIDGQKITATKFGEENVTSVGGADFFGKGIPVFDAAVKFGPPTLRFTNKLSFVLSTTDGSPIGLDELAQVDFGLRHSKITEKFFTKLPAAPNAEDDFASAFEDQPTTFDVLSNDTDLDLKDILRVVNFTKPQHGNISIASNGSTVTYTPDLDYSGPDTFTYTIQDDGLPPGLTAKQIAALLAKKLYAVGSDTATVTVNVVAVADKPDIEIAAKAGATVNEILIDVSALTTDTDGSEYIDRLEFTGLAPGATIEGAVNGVLDFSGTSNDGITSTIKLILAPNTSFDFDLGIVAVAKEESNADEETATATLKVELDTVISNFDRTFDAVDRSIWSNADAIGFKDTDFFGIDETFEDPAEADVTFPILPSPIPVSVSADVDGVLKAGAQYDIEVRGGTVDAHAPFHISLTTSVNRTTDVFSIAPAVQLRPGLNFTTEGPGGHFFLDAIMKIDLHSSVSAGIPGLDLLSFELPPIFVDESERFVDISDTDTINIPLPLGFSGTVGFPTGLNASATSNTNVASDATDSANILDIDWNIGVAVTQLVPPAGVLFAPIPFFTAIPPAAWNITGIVATMGIGANVLQNFDLTMNGLQLSATFENGDTRPVDLATGLTLSNASALDLDGDGIEFTLSMDPVANFVNDTDLGFNFEWNLDILRLKTTVPIPIPFVDDLKIDQALIDLGQSPKTIAEIDISRNEFSLDFQSQTADFFI